MTNSRTYIIETLWKKVTKLWKCAGDGGRKRRRCLRGTSAGQEGSIADCSVLAKYLSSAVALKQTLVQSYYFFKVLIRMNKIVISYVKIFTVVTLITKKDF